MILKRMVSCHQTPRVSRWKNFIWRPAEFVATFSWTFLRPLFLEIEGRKSAKNFAIFSPHLSPMSAKNFARISLSGFFGVKNGELLWATILKHAQTLFLWGLVSESKGRKRGASSLVLSPTLTTHTPFKWKIGSVVGSANLGHPQFCQNFPNPLYNKRFHSRTGCPNLQIQPPTDPIPQLKPSDLIKGVNLHPSITGYGWSGNKRSELW